MINTSRILLAASLMTLLGTLCPQIRAQELLSNTGFEDGTKYWNPFIPKESEGKNCKAVISSDLAHGGKSSMMLQSDDYARHGVGGKNIPVKAGERYRLSFWILADAKAAVRPDDGAIAVRMLLLSGSQDLPMSPAIYVGTNGKYSLQYAGRGVHLSGLSGTLPTQWTQCQAVVEIPNLQNLEKMSVMFFSWYAKGTLHIDDISLEKVDASTPLSPSIPQVPASGQKTMAPTDDAQMIAALNYDFPGMEKVKAAAEANDLAAIKREYLAFRRTASKARYYVMPDQKPTEAKAQSDQYGDEICNHYIRNIFYGFKPLAADMGKDFNWKFNPVSPASPDFTHEWTWCAISRMQFWRLLGEAYWKTLNEKYAEEWVAQLLDFAKKCPINAIPGPGEPSLWRTLDASERMYDSWPYIYAHVINSPAFTPDAQWTYIKMVRDHISLLKTGLLDKKRSGNWVSSESYGLLAIGMLYPELKDAPACREIAMDRLTTELDRQVLPDGFQAELTPSYHCFALSTFVGPYQLLKLNNMQAPSIFEHKLKSMYQALVTVMDQSGTVVATNDSGAVNAAQMAKMGLQLFPGDPLLEWAASGGQNGAPLPASTALPYAGFYTMRGGWNRNDVFLFFRGGPTGIGHEHEDMLQVVMRAWNRTLLMEPGSYLYDHSKWRYFALDTASHNTILVDGKSQHRGLSNLEEMKLLPNAWVTSPLFDFAAATYNSGYQQSQYDGSKQYTPRQWIGEKDYSVSHTRRVLFLRPYYAIVLDTLDGTGKHVYDAHFNIDSPSARIEPESQAIFSQNQQDVQIGLFPLDRENLTADILQGQEEPMRGWQPGTHRPVPCARFRKEQNAPAIFATMLYPYHGSQPTLAAMPLKIDAGNFWSQSIRTPNENAEIVLSKTNQPSEFKITSASAGDISANASALIIRQSIQDKAVFTGGWNLSSYQGQTCKFTMSQPATLAWRQSDKELLICNASAEAAMITVTSPVQQKFTLSPGMWTSLTNKGATPAQAPAFFKQPKVVSNAPAYQDYFKASASEKSTDGQALSFSPEQLELPKGIIIRGKVGITGKAAIGWDETGSSISMRVPRQGWYRVKIRYCSQGDAVRALLVNGTVPFAEAEEIVFPSTMGAPPSDGWSNMTDDWKTLSLGESSTRGGWVIHIPKNDSMLSLRNVSAGCNLALIELEPVKY